MEKKEKKEKKSFKEFKAKAKDALTPKFVKKREEKFAEEVAAVDLSRLDAPYNDPKKTGNTKVRDFSPWERWKVFLVGFIAVVVFFFAWWLATYLNSDLKSFLSNPVDIFNALIDFGFSPDREYILWTHIGYSLSRVLVGYVIALVTSIPIAFLMAWYKPFRAVLDPFIQFLRCIPPLAYVPIIVVALGTGESSKYFIIWLACFLTMTVTIYQGIRNVDMTLIKASYTFGARDKNLFVDVVVPSSFPFILTAMRLGVGVALTTLIAAELTGGRFGLGAFVNSMGNVTRFAEAFMGIIILGAIGIIFDKLLLLLERRLTRWK